MVTFDNAIHDKNKMALVVWAALLKKGTHDRPRQRRLKEMADHLHFRKEEIEGMAILEAVRRASR